MVTDESSLLSPRKWSLGWGSLATSCFSTPPTRSLLTSWVHLIDVNCLGCLPQQKLQCLAISHFRADRDSAWLWNRSESHQLWCCGRLLTVLYTSVGCHLAPAMHTNLKNRCHWAQVNCVLTCEASQSIVTAMFYKATGPTLLLYQPGNNGHYSFHYENPGRFPPSCSGFFS